MPYDKNVIKWMENIPEDHRWVFDAVSLYNRGTYLYYLRDHDQGPYIEHTKEDRLVLGTYECCGPHITDSIFHEDVVLAMSRDDANKFLKEVMR